MTQEQQPSGHSERRTRDPGKPFAEPEDLTAELIERLAERSSHVLVKKLARNDLQWAIWNEEARRWRSKQAGPYLPAVARTSGFFPQLTPDPGKQHNKSAAVRVYWPTTGKVYDSRFIWYSGKGAEHHLTTNPRSEFGQLSPASYLLVFKVLDSGTYRAVTVDSADEALTDYISELFDIREDFHFRLYDAKDLPLRPVLTALQQLVEDLAIELAKGPAGFDAFIRKLKRRPAAEISAAAFDQWKRDTGQPDLNPYVLANPGDVLYDLTRNREFALYKEDEAKTYGAHLVQALLGAGRAATPKELIRSFVERFDVFYAVFMKASQARVSRVGGTFETHMKAALSAADIPHSPQFIFDGSKPDFVLPSGATYANAAHRRDLAVVLTLKTTLRERWKQVVSESTGCPIYLATLDEGVSGATLDKLAARDIRLVVPERFKTSDYAEYRARDSVLTYRSFFDELRGTKGQLWLDSGIACYRSTPGGRLA